MSASQISSPSRNWVLPPKIKSDNHAEKKELEQIILNLQRQLEDERNKNRILLAQKKIDNLSADIKEVSSNVSIERLSSLASSQTCNQFLEENSQYDFSQLDRILKIYKELLPDVRNDMRSLNKFCEGYNQLTFNLLSNDNVRAWRVDASSYPVQITKKLKEIQTFKQEIETILQTNFLTFEAEKLPSLKRQYDVLKKAFEDFERFVLDLETNSNFFELLKKMFSIKMGLENALQDEDYEVIYQSDARTSLKMDIISTDELKGWVRDEYATLRNRHQSRYQHLLQATCENWFSLMTETILIRSTLQCLGETIGLILPIRNLQEKTVAMRSFSITTISSSRKTTQQTGKADLADLSKNLDQLRISFKSCSKKKSEIVSIFTGAEKRLSETHTSLIGRLTAQQEILMQFSSDPIMVKNQIEKLKLKIKEERVLLSSHLTASWDEISAKLPESASYLDQIHYAVNYNKGYIPKDYWFYTIYYPFYKSQSPFYKMLAEPNMIASSSSDLLVNDEPPIRPPLDDDPLTRDIPIQNLPFKMPKE